MDEGITIKFDDGELIKLLRDISGRMQDLEPIMGKIAGDLHDSVTENFAAQGRPDKWRRSQRAEREGGETLHDTGGLIGSLTPSHTSTSATVSTAKEYARLQHHGAAKGSFGRFVVVVKEHKRIIRGGKTVTVKGHSRTQSLPWGTIPARPFMLFQEEDAAQTKQDLNEYLFTIK